MGCGGDVPHVPGRLQDTLQCLSSGAGRRFGSGTSFRADEEVSPGAVVPEHAANGRAKPRGTTEQPAPSAKGGGETSVFKP